MWAETRIETLPTSDRERHPEGSQDVSLIPTNTSRAVCPGGVEE